MILYYEHNNEWHLPSCKKSMEQNRKIFIPQKPKWDLLCNGCIAIIAKVIKNITASAAETKIRTTYIFLRRPIPMETTLIKIGHPQPTSSTCTDNTTHMESSAI